MSGSDRSRAEQIRALIDEADRVRGESERIITEIDRGMKRPFWPERRRFPRISGSERPDGNGGGRSR
jgi:hypothetical protein